MCDINYFWTSTFDSARIILLVEYKRYNNFVRLMKVATVRFLKILNWEGEYCCVNSRNKARSIGVNSSQLAHAHRGGHRRRLIYFNHPQVIKVSFVVGAMTRSFSFSFSRLAIRTSTRPSREVRDGATGY